MNPVLAVTGVLSALIFIYATIAGLAEWRLISKPLPVLCLILWLLPLKGRDRQWIALGLVFSLVGDLCLEWSERTFLAGLIAFLFGHLCYVVAYLEVTRQPRWRVALAASVFGVIVFFFLQPHLGALRWPVLLYTLVICAMLWRAWAQVGLRPTEANKAWWAAIGATSFVLSDVLVAWNQFIERSTAIAVILIILYWGGQLAIARSASGNAIVPARPLEDEIRVPHKNLG